MFQRCASVVQAAQGLARKARAAARRQRSQGLGTTTVAPDEEEEVACSRQGRKRRSSAIIVRALSGSVVVERDATLEDTKVSKIVEDVCRETGADRDSVQLCAGGRILKHSAKLCEAIEPVPAEFGEGEAAPVELTLMRLSGPIIRVESVSRSEIKVLEGVPSKGAKCHFDRHYVFRSLGEFASMDNVRYVMTSNDDKRTPPHRVMWKVHVIVPVTVYLNFRSETHMSQTGAQEWLQEMGWQRSELKGSVSSGYPNGPYSGPVYTKSVDSGTVDLMGANCSEGAYFVFVELCM